MRGALVALEVGLAVLPLVGATLLLRSFAELRGVDLGFETERVLVANLPLPEERYSTGEARFGFFEAITERARAIPGVEAVGFANRFPLRGGWESGLDFDGDTAEANHSAAFQAIEAYRIAGDDPRAAEVRHRATRICWLIGAGASASLLLRWRPPDLDL
mgnify:CR=1 FL=1